MKKSDWFTEYTDTVTCKQATGFRLQVSERLVQDKSDFQKIEIINTPAFGKVLLLDDFIMITEKDEFVYHDMIAHVPANLLLSQGIQPQSALVIGGGDGGTVRELLKHNSIKKITLCEIDGKVVDYCREYFPTVSCKLDDPRVNVVIGDGIAYTKEHNNEFDIICVDSTDPVGPAVGLFNRAFYESVFEALTPQGVMTAQSESAIYNILFIKEVQEILKSIFPYSTLYQAAISTYPSGTWAFSIASKKIDPHSCNDPQFHNTNTFQSTYYNSRVHQGAFALPTWIQKKLHIALDSISH